MQVQYNFLFFKAESFKKSDNTYCYRITLLDHNGNRYQMFYDIDLWQKRHKDIQQMDEITCELSIYVKDSKTSSYGIYIKEIEDNE